MPKHLYIHIPFCNAICTYCDFKRYIKNDEIKNEYVARIIHDIKKIDNNKFDSIYIGGGTPNCLSDSALSLLLNECKKHCSKKTEFTIECNPESVNDKQVKIFIKNNVNRVSLGVQTTNNALLKRMNRKHNLNDVKNAIKIFRNNNLNNISCDFIYGFNEIKNTDLKTTINFINEYKIPHVSFYSLETKPNSILTKTGYKIKEEKQESDLKYIESHLKLSRYEISNWCLNKQYESVHNKGYWLTNEWIGIGLGASGFEHKCIYENVGTIQKWKKKNNKLNNKQYYFQILMMGLRLVKGINLKLEKNKKAFDFYKNKLKYFHIKNNYLIADNINLLNNTLIDCL